MIATEEKKDRGSDFYFYFSSAGRGELVRVNVMLDRPTYFAFQAENLLEVVKDLKMD